MQNEKANDINQLIQNFYILFQKEIIDLLPENNSSELSQLLFRAVLEIYFVKDISPSILSKRLAITVPNTSRSLQKLAQLGYITKRKDYNDKRVTHIILTQKGLDLVERSVKATDEEVLRKIGLLDPDEQSKFADAFSTLYVLFEKIGEKDIKLNKRRELLK